MGQAQWADTGTALKSTALARPSPLGIVPVPGPHIWPMGQHEARHEKRPGPASARLRAIMAVGSPDPCDSSRWIPLLGWGCI